MKTILITGATGLIGKEVLNPLLEDGFKVYALTISDEIPNNQVVWIKCNIFDSQNLEKIFDEIKPKYLLHIAWIATGDYLNSNTNFDFLTASMNLLKFFNKNGGKKAILTGSYFEYEFKEEPLKETDPIKPLGIYGLCKNYTKELAEAYCKLNNIDFVWTRVFNVCGKGEQAPRLTGAIIKNLSENKEMVIKSGSLFKDYIYTKDIAGAWVAIFNSSVTGVINISSGKSISIKEYATLLATKLNKAHLLKFVDDIGNQPRYVIGDNTRLTQEVGYKIKYSIDDALSEIVEVLDEK